MSEIIPSLQLIDTQNSTVSLILVHLLHVYSWKLVQTISHQLTVSLVPIFRTTSIVMFILVSVKPCLCKI